MALPLPLGVQLDVPDVMARVWLPEKALEMAAELWPLDGFMIREPRPQPAMPYLRSAARASRDPTATAKLAHTRRCLNTVTALAWTVAFLRV
jgi:hypothetical protein